MCKTSAKKSLNPASGGGGNPLKRRQGLLLDHHPCSSSTNRQWPHPTWSRNRPSLISVLNSSQFPISSRRTDLLVIITTLLLRPVFAHNMAKLILTAPKSRCRCKNVVPSTVRSKSDHAHLRHSQKPKIMNNANKLTGRATARRSSPWFEDMYSGSQVRVVSI